jgi:hypothetical protein
LSGAVGGWGEAVLAQGRQEKGWGDESKSDFAKATNEVA